MDETSIGRLADSHVVSVTVSTRAETAARAMKGSNLSLLPVLKGGRLVGIITKKDLETSLASHKSVRELMKKPLLIRKNRTLTYAIKYITKHRVSRIPVVDSELNMLFIGIVTASQLLKAKKAMQKRK